jgi:poly(hydroxyalkanoate) depolymerase family esterase
LPGGPPTEPPPLIVMLHGCKQDPVDFARGTQMNVWAEQQGCAVLYPAQTEVANRYACWNWYLPIHQQRGLGEPALLAGMIEQLVGKHSLNPRRVFVAGLSAGAAMANVLAHTYPELFAGLGVHSGLPYTAAHDVITALAVMKHGRRATRWPYLHPSLPPFAPHNLPLIVFHGDADTTVHPLNGEQVVDQALREEHAPGSGGHETLPPPTVQTGQAAGGHAYTLTTYGAPQGLPALEYWLVEGLEHAWSGGDGRGSFTDSQGPVASQEMLRFFLEQPPARPRQRLAEAEATGDVAKPSDPLASG